MHHDPRVSLPALRPPGLPGPPGPSGADRVRRVGSEIRRGAYRPPVDAVVERLLGALTRDSARRFQAQRPQPR